MADVSCKFILPMSAMNLSLHYIIYILRKDLPVTSEDRLLPASCAFSCNHHGSVATDAHRSHQCINRHRFSSSMSSSKREVAFDRCNKLVRYVVLTSCNRTSRTHHTCILTAPQTAACVLCTNLSYRRVASDRPFR